VSHLCRLVVSFLHLGISFESRRFAACLIFVVLVCRLSLDVLARVEVNYVLIGILSIKCISLLIQHTAIASINDKK
jgi:hypothetical protein